MLFNNQKNHKDHTDLVILCSKCRKYMSDQLGTAIPEKGKTRGFQVHFKNPVKEWQIADCGLRIVQSFKGDDIRAVEIYATFPDGSGYEMKNILAHGTNGEIKVFLADDALTQSMVETYAHFSDSIADKL